MIAPLATSAAGPSKTPAGVASDCLVTVTDLAREVGVTARALRFYEDKGLIVPLRVGTTRVYTNRERARMILILRGKRLGFSLREIKDYLDLYDVDPRQVTQTKALLARIAERRRELEDRRDALEQALCGLDDLERDATAFLTKADLRRVKAKPEQPEAGAVSSTGRASGMPKKETV